MNCFRKLIKKYPKLYIPEWIYFLDQCYIDKNTNGCGDKKTRWFVPQKLFGLLIKPACKIHDLEYTRIINLYNSYLLFDPIHIAEAKSLMMEANVRLKMNIEVLGDYEAPTTGMWNRFKNKLYYKVADWFFWGVDEYGWSSLQKSFKK